MGQNTLCSFERRNALCRQEEPVRPRTGSVAVDAVSSADASQLALQDFDHVRACEDVMVQPCSIRYAEDDEPTLCAGKGHTAWHVRVSVIKGLLVLEVQVACFPCRFVELKLDVGAQNVIF